MQPPYFGLGNALQELGRHEEAIAAYGASLDRNYANVDIHYNLA